jgi:VanZ family protein
MKHRNIKWLSFLPAFFMLALIFLFSAQNGTDSSSLSLSVGCAVVEAKNAILQDVETPAQVVAQARSIQFYIRKAAHMSEYALLCASYALPFHVYGWRPKHRRALMLGLCAVTAGLDELHQRFVSGRTAALRDVAIDTAGAAIALGLLWLAGKLLQKRRAKAKPSEP